MASMAGVVALVAATLGVPSRAVQADGPPVAFGPETHFATGDNPGWGAAADLNGDAFLDLVIANGSGAVSVLLGDGTGSFGAATNFAVSGPAWVEVADLNGDTFPDLVVAKGSGAVSVLLGDGTGNFGAATDFPAGDYLFAVAVGDLNGDTFPDLAATSYYEGTVSVLLGDGTGGFGTATDLTVGWRPAGVEVGDLNGDTVSDLVVTDHWGTVSVFLGDGSGGLGSEQRYRLPYGGAYMMAVGDLNGDSLPDVALANYIQGTATVLLSDGSGSFDYVADYGLPAMADPAGIAVGDLNGDTFPDLAVANGTARSVSVFLGDGTGGFGIPSDPDIRTDFATDDRPAWVALGDLNGDAALDLAVSHPERATVSVRLNTTGGDTTPPAVTCDTPAPQFALSQSAALVWATVADEPGGSGPLASRVSEPADTSSVGPKTVELTGQDQAGNSTTVSCPYTVLYQANQQQFFTAPVDNETVNQAKAGRVVPIKWQITDANGTPITDLTTATLASKPVDCVSGASDAIEEYATTAGGSGLQNLGDGYYQYNWTTDKAWAGTCRTVHLDLGEGITHTAHFKFVK
jgi:hypothetical protein